MQRLPLEYWSQQDRRFVSRGLACVLVFYTLSLVAILWLGTEGHLFASKIDRTQAALASEQFPPEPWMKDAD